MSECAKEWDTFEDALKTFSDEVATLKVAKHECEEHKDESVCMEMPYYETFKEDAERELSDAVTSLARCLRSTTYE